MSQKGLYRGFILILIFLISLTINVNLYADRIDELIKNVPGVETYKDASAIHVFTEVEMEVRDDYSYTQHVFSLRKILNYKGKKEYSDVTLSYNADYEKIEPGKCFSIDPSGKRIPIPENQINDLNSSTSIMHPLINFRETIINFPQIEPGYFIVLDYTVINNRRKPITGVEHFRGSNPHMHKTFSLRFPKKFKLNTYFDKDKLMFLKKKKGKFKIYTWEIKNTTLIKEESHSPFYLISGIPVVYSFYKDWQELAKEKLSKLIDLQVEDSIKELAKTITAKCKNDNEKMLEMYKYFANHFNYQYSYLGQTDEGPRVLTEIVKDKKGSQIDLVALFMAMVKSVGVKNVYPALTLSYPNRFAKVQEKMAVNEFLGRLCLFWDNRLFTIGLSQMPYGFCNYDLNIIIGNKKFEFLRFHHKNRFNEKHLYTYDITGHSAIVSIKSVFADMKNRMYRSQYLDQPQARRKIWFNQSLGVTSAALIEGPNFLNFDKIEEDLKLEYKLQYKHFLTDQAPYVYFKLFGPRFQLDVSLKSRENDLQVFQKIFSKEEFIINLDRKRTFINPIKDMTFEFPMGETKAYFRLNSQKKGEQIVVNREIYIPEAIVEKESYQAFKKFILKIQNPMNNMIFLQASGGQ
jgi:hypothetical protein